MTPWRPYDDPIVTLWSVQYGHSVQYSLGLLHAATGNGPPIGLTLTGRIHREIIEYTVVYYSSFTIVFLLTIVYYSTFAIVNDSIDCVYD